MGTTGNLIFYLILLIRFQQVEDEFLDSAWYLIGEVYCQIHQKINCANLSKRLDLSQEEGEKWIVSLIREMKMGAGAKVDLEEVRSRGHANQKKITRVQFFISPGFG